LPRFFFPQSEMGVDEEAVVKFLVAENPSRRQVGKSDWSDAIFWTSRSLTAAHGQTNFARTTLQII